jgi:hypothetical protein
MLENYWGRNTIHLHSDYAGAIVLVLAGAAFIGLRSDPRRKEILFWSVTLLVTLLWSLGSATPFYHLPYALVPGTKFFRAPATIFFIGTLAIAMLACVGTERFLQGRVTRKYLLGWLIGAAVVALLATTGGLTNVAETFAGDQQIDAVQANNGALIAGAWRSFAFVALFVALGFATFRGQISIRGSAWVLAALLAIDLWTVERIYWMFSAPASVIYASDPIVDMLKIEPQPARVLALDLQRKGLRDPFLSGDALMTYRIRNVRGYHGNQLGRYEGAPGGPNTDLTGVYSGDNRLFSPNVLALTNTKYLLTNIPEFPYLPNVALAKGPVRNAAGDTVYLYRVNADNPYAWLTPVAVKAADDQTLATILNPRFNVKLAALFDTSAKVRVSEAVQSLPSALPIAATVSHYEAGKVHLDLSAPAPQGSSLVVSENYYPGWQASVDGKPAHIGRADYTLIGVELPAGARSVDLTFTSPAYQRGKVITWLAIALGFLMLASGMWLDRRRIA